MDYIWWIVILVVVLVLALGGWWLSRRASPNRQAEAVPIPVIDGPAPQETPDEDVAADAAAIIGGAGRLTGDGVGNYLRRGEQMPVPVGARLGVPGSDQAPTGYPIKGDAEAEIYYTPDGPGYDDAQAQVWFASEGAARAAGFHRAETP